MGYYLEVVHRWLSEQTHLCWAFFRRFCGVMGGFGLSQWLMVLAVVLLFALFALRGYGSRSSY